ncbi:MAG: ABC transporter substrate-binding protein [Chloroflexia bacterium]|nr:ABC transporter substrate-binding protein [Chloroflexia bacterium]
MAPDHLERGLNRRSFVGLGLGAAGLAAVAASRPSVALGAQPATGGTLRFTQPIPITPFEFQQLGPHTSALLQTVFDTVVRFDEQRQPQPWLAESWAENEGNTELTLNLRRGVTYHTGREFTSEDVQFNVERVRDPAIASQLRPNSLTVTDMVLPDPYTIVFRFAQPNPIFFEFLFSLAMLDRETAADLEGARQVIGTGPFRWQDYVPGNSVTLVRNDTYWQAGKPLLDGIEVQIVDDKQSMVLSVESGQQDVAWQVLPQDLARLSGNPQVQPLVSEAGAQYYYIGAVTTADLVSDKRVRQAINAAIDRQRITQTLLFGLVEPTALPWPKNVPGYDAEIDGSVTFDLEKARRLFEEAGVAPGTTIVLEANAQDPQNAAIGQIVQADLATIGINLDLQTVENSVFQERLNTAGFQQLYANTMGGAQNINWFAQVFPVRISGNASRYDAPAYVDLVNAMLAEPDDAARQPLYDQVNRLLVDESFNMPICQAPQGWVLRGNVTDFAYDPGNILHLEDTYLA